MRRRYTHLQTGEEYVPIPDAVCIEETERGVRLRLRSGRDEWFPKAHVVECHDGWFIKKWLADKRRSGRWDRVSSATRVAHVEVWLLPFFLFFSLLWLGAVEVWCNTRSGVLAATHER